jgi:transposase
VHDTGPGPQEWAAKMACLLLRARDAAAAARRAGQDKLDPGLLDELVTRYRATTAEGTAANDYRYHTANSRRALTLACRFAAFEDMILRFATHPGLDIFTSNQAERTIRPVKVQQRSSGGCWRTLDGLADFATVQSYLSTATKWGATTIDALRSLFSGHPWIPPALQPDG